MATPVPADVGKHILLDRDSTIRSEKIYHGEHAMVVEHHVITGKASSNTTNVAIFSAHTMAEILAGRAGSDSVAELANKWSRVLLVGLKNTELAKMAENGQWQGLFATGPKTHMNRPVMRNDVHIAIHKPP